MSLKYEITQMGLKNLNSVNNSTQKQMRSNCKKFSHWCCSNGYNKLSKIYNAGKENVLQQYCDYMITKNFSPATIHTYLSAPCKALSVPMNLISKPKRNANTITRSRDSSKNVQGQIESYNKKYDRLISFQKITGLRRAEISKIKGKHLTRDESGKVCIEVERGKGGKYQLQRILPENVAILYSIFDGIKEDEFLFSSVELRNKIDLHKLRAENARNAYQYYASMNLTEKKVLVTELKKRWLITHPNHDETSKKYKQWLEQMVKGNGVYRLRGNNYDRALINGRPTSYDRISLMAVSMFHLSHFRLSVAVVNYMI